MQLWTTTFNAMSYECCSYLLLSSSHTLYRHARYSVLGTRHLFLVDPVVRSLLVGVELLLLEPEVDLVLGGLDTVGAVADIAADILSSFY